MIPENKSHEVLTREETVSVGTEKSFGIVFSIFFAIITCGDIYFAKGLSNSAYFLFLASLFFLITAFTAPQLLRPFNKLWFHFGLFLHAIVNPLIMGLLFFGTVMPIGMMLRVFGRRPLNLYFDSKAESYWIDRDPVGPVAGSFKNQY
jgi:hypothetical protein